MRSITKPLAIGLVHLLPNMGRSAFPAVCHFMMAYLRLSANVNFVSRQFEVQAVCGKSKSRSVLYISIVHMCTKMNAVFSMYPNEGFLWEKKKVFCHFGVQYFYVNFRG